MKLVLVRHGEPDYEMVERLGFKGMGVDFAPLTNKGVFQATQVSWDSRFEGAEIIVSSPYTRALQTAGMIAGKANCLIEVQPALHEWLPDVLFHHSGEEYTKEAWLEYQLHSGKQDNTCKYNWEETASIGNRVFDVMHKYLNFSKIIVVCHGMVMRQFEFQEHIPHCGIIEYEFTKDSKPVGFVPASKETLKQMGYNV